MWYKYMIEIEEIVKRRQNTANIESAYAPYSYLITQESGYIIAINGATGEVDYSGTNPCNVANSALANANVGGIVKFNGTFPITDIISVDKDITLDLRGATFKTFVNIIMLGLYSATIHIIGGNFVNSNSAPTHQVIGFGSARGTITGTTVVGGLNGIDIATTGNISIRDCVIHDSKANGIIIEHSTPGHYLIEPVLIENCRLYNNLYSGVTTSRARHTTIRGCYIYNNIEEGISIKNSQYIDIEANYIYNNLEHGIVVTLDEAAVANSSHVWIVHNHIYSNTMNGIRVFRQDYPDLTCSNITIGDNVLSNNCNDAANRGDIEVDALDSKICGNYLYSPGIGAVVAIRTNYGSGFVYENNVYGYDSSGISLSPGWKARDNKIQS